MREGCFPLCLEPRAGWGGRGQVVGKGCSGLGVQVTKPVFIVLLHTRTPV